MSSVAHTTRICLALVAVLCFVNSRARGMDRLLPSACDGRNAWIVVERTQPTGREYVLLHHATAMGGAYVREVITLPSLPEAMTAQADRLWLVLTPSTPESRRDVYSVSAVRNPATGAFYSQPPGAMLIHPSLSAAGRLRGIAPLGDGLLALREGAGLEQLGSRGWSLVEPAPATVGMSLSNLGGVPTLVDALGNTLSRAADGKWSATQLAAVGPGFIQLIDGSSRASALVRTEGGARAIVYLRPGGSMRLTTVASSERASTIVALGDSFRVFLPTGDGGASMQSIDPVGGAVSSAVLLTTQPSDATRWVCLAAGVFAFIGLLFGVFVRRSLALKSSTAERR